MKVDIRRVSCARDEKAVIHTVDVTESILEAADILRNNGRSIPVLVKEEIHMCPFERIYYAESVDKHTFIYTKDSCYETRKCLYELEEVFPSDFFRCSKSMILNIRKISSVKADFNARMKAILLNGEQIIISRNYVKELKERLGL